MKRFLQSLYARLVLVLLVALAASFATMYLLFQFRLEETQESHYARVIASRVQLVEELLHERSVGDLSKIRGIVIAPSVAPVVGDATAGNPRLSRLRSLLKEELEREVELRPAANSSAGFWIDLRGGSGAGQWLFIATRNPRAHPFDPLLPALLVGFAIVLAGGMLLLWQIQRPLKRLGNALGAVGQATPATLLPVAGAGETRVLAERYNDMVARLHEYEEERATMLAGVAHDLRSPITRLRLLLELESGSRAAEVEHNLDDIERITEQFLVYARRSVADEPLELRDLGPFAEEVAAPFAGRGVSLACDSDELLVPIRADSLRRALINLIENALEYGAAPVTVRVVRRDGDASIAVEDRGQGIAAEHIPRALRPFTRLDSSRGGKGHCGLGLVIVARIAEAHRGGLQLRNRTGGGLIAEILLPTVAATGT